MKSTNILDIRKNWTWVWKRKEMGEAAISNSGRPTADMLI